MLTTLVRAYTVVVNYHQGVCLLYVLNGRTSPALPFTSVFPERKKERQGRKWKRTWKGGKERNETDAMRCDARNKTQAAAAAAQRDL